MSFLDVLALLRARDLTSIAPALVARGATTVALLRGLSEADLVAVVECRPDVDRLLGALGWLKHFLRRNPKSQMPC